MFEFLYPIFYGILWTVFHLTLRIRTGGRAHIPEGAAVVCGNHSSLADPLLVAIKLRGPAGIQRTRFMAKIELSRVPVLGRIISPFIIFIDRGKSDIAAMKATLRLLKGGGKIVIFPEGTRVAEGEDSQAKAGAAMFAVKSGAPILPVFVTRGKKTFLRRVDVVYGEPYHPQMIPGVPSAEMYRRIADDLLRRIAALDPERRPAEAA